MFLALLVALDPSGHAQRALDQAVALAQTTNARLTLMTVVPQPLEWGLGSGYDVAVDRADLREQAEQACLQVLHAALETVPMDLSVSTILKRGPAGPAIADQAADGAHDLIVMGSRGRGELRSLLLGSVSHHVLHATFVPVLIVRDAGAPVPCAGSDHLGQRRSQHSGELDATPHLR
jgi:nucleotide-binding universal stress UspA family protein